ncbi:hypothetical protein BDV41DRAFT_540483 [Aspergillus transmontanensis]|uniref:Uncharacterized protein n=1 Tax=Aspergillus transmontanensis TaxID=1034304 RepID=A0A5N6VVZ1_9EURO|nr:hypothetical protein BDV41DRAFT_540483 [Aspergillus transmontanensis]
MWQKALPHLWKRQMKDHHQPWILWHQNQGWNGHHPSWLTWIQPQKRHRRADLPS